MPLTQTNETKGALGELLDIAGILEDFGATGSAERVYAIRAKLAALIEACGSFDIAIDAPAIGDDELMIAHVALTAGRLRAFSKALAGITGEQ